MTDYQKKGFLTEDYRLFHLRSDRGTRLRNFLKGITSFIV